MFVSSILDICFSFSFFVFLKITEITKLLRLNKCKRNREATRTQRRNQRKGEAMKCDMEKETKKEAEFLRLSTVRYNQKGKRAEFI